MTSPFYTKLTESAICPDMNMRLSEHFFEIDGPFPQKRFNLTDKSIQREKILTYAMMQIQYKSFFHKFSYDQPLFESGKERIDAVLMMDKNCINIVESKFLQTSCSEKTFNATFQDAIDQAEEYFVKMMQEKTTLNEEFVQNGQTWITVMILSEDIIDKPEKIDNYANAQNKLKNKYTSFVEHGMFILTGVVTVRNGTSTFTEMAAGPLNILEYRIEGNELAPLPVATIKDLRPLSESAGFIEGISNMRVEPMYREKPRFFDGFIQTVLNAWSNNDTTFTQKATNPSTIALIEKAFLTFSGQNSRILAAPHLVVGNGQTSTKAYSTVATALKELIRTVLPNEFEHDSQRILDIKKDAWGVDQIKKKIYAAMKHCQLDPKNVGILQDILNFLDKSVLRISFNPSPNGTELTQHITTQNTHIAQTSNDVLLAEFDQEKRLMISETAKLVVDTKPIILKTIGVSMNFYNSDNAWVVPIQNIINFYRLSDTYKKVLATKTDRSRTSAIFAFFKEGRGIAELQKNNTLGNMFKKEFETHDTNHDLEKLQNELEESESMLEAYIGQEKVEQLVIANIKRLSEDIEKMKNAMGTTVFTKWEEYKKHCVAYVYAMDVIENEFETELEILFTNHFLGHDSGYKKERFFGQLACMLIHRDGGLDAKKWTKELLRKDIKYLYNAFMTEATKINKANLNSYNYHATFSSPNNKYPIGGITITARETVFEIIDTFNDAYSPVLDLIGGPAKTYGIMEKSNV